MNYNNKLNNFDIFKYVVIILLCIIFLRTCSLSTSKTDKKVDVLENKIDSIQTILSKIPTKNDLMLEGLKVEKRMIQSTDRKLLDVNRQKEIDKLIEKMNNE